MIPDAECVRIVSEILSQLELGSFVIKVSLYSMGGSRQESWALSTVGQPSQGAGWDV